MAGRTPDWILMATHPAFPKKGHKVAAGWDNDTGTISIDLDTLTVLRGIDNLQLTLCRPKAKDGKKW